MHKKLDTGQLLIIGFDGTEMSGQLRSLLTRLQPAGVILFARNITSADQTYKLLKDCQACVSEPLFSCVDMEGGRVDRFRNVTGPTPSAADVFATGDRKLFRKHGQMIGETCRTLGFNTDFAPVVDLALEASRTVMSSREVSADPKQAVAYAARIPRRTSLGARDSVRLSIFPDSARQISTRTTNCPAWKEPGRSSGRRISILTVRYGGNYP